MLGACLSIQREPRWQREGVDARRAAQAVAGPTAKPRNTADAPPAANPSGPGKFRFMHCCRLLIGIKPNRVASASPGASQAAGPKGDPAESPPSALLALVVGPPRLRARALKADFLLGHAGTHLV